MIVETRFSYKAGLLLLNEDPLCNIININNSDFLVNYLDPTTRKHKGGNSYIFVLYSAQDLDEDINNIQDERPHKVIKVSKYYDNVYSNKKIIKSKFNSKFYREIDAIKACNEMQNPNVVDIYADGHLFVSTEHGKMAFPFYVMDYVDYDLKKYLEEIDLDFNERINICLQIATGIRGLYDAGYYHRDIKPDNILIFDGREMKVADLGLAAHRDDDESDQEYGIIGPRGWLSPEAMNKYLSVGFNDKNYDCKIDHQSDIFQLGKLFWYIIQGNAPIGCISRNDFFDKHDDVYNLLKFMLNHSKKKRPITITKVITELERILNKLSSHYA